MIKQTTRIVALCVALAVWSPALRAAARPSSPVSGARKAA
jgi:hypothetical protein